MASLNKVLLIGNLTRDPEKRFTPSGMAVTELSLAVNRKFKDARGEMREEVCFVNVTVWGRQAELCTEYLRKGSPLFVEGRLKLDQWEKDGEKRSRLTVVAERTQFLGGPSARAESHDGPGDAEEWHGGGENSGGSRRSGGGSSAPGHHEGPRGEPEKDDDLPF